MQLLVQKILQLQPLQDEFTLCSVLRHWILWEGGVQGIDGSKKCAPLDHQKRFKKKKKSYLFYSVSDLSSREHLIQSTPSDILKLQLTNIYWVTPFAQVILLGLLTQARLLTHIELFYDQPCHLLLLGVDFIWFIQK